MQIARTQVGLSLYFTCQRHGHRLLIFNEDRDMHIVYFSLSLLYVYSILSTTLSLRRNDDIRLGIAPQFIVVNQTDENTKCLQQGITVLTVYRETIKMVVDFVLHMSSPI